MRCDDPAVLQRWALQWRGAGATFEFGPVVPSEETSRLVFDYLDSSHGGPHGDG